MTHEIRKIQIKNFLFKIKKQHSISSLCSFNNNSRLVIFDVPYKFPSIHPQNKYLF